MRTSTSTPAHDSVPAHGKDPSPSMDLSYETRPVDGWQVVSVGGEIDVYSAAALRDPLNDLVDQPGAHVLLDLDRVDFLDSMGLRVIVGAHKRSVATGGGFGIVCSRPTIVNVLHITGLDTVIPLYPSVPAAVAAQPGSAAS